MTLDTRNEAGQAIQGGILGSDNAYRLYSTITLDSTPTFSTTRPWGALAAGSSDLVTETTTGASTSDSIKYGDLFLLCVGAIGAPRKSKLMTSDPDGPFMPVPKLSGRGLPLFRYDFYRNTFKVGDLKNLWFGRGGDEGAEFVDRAAVTALGMSVNQNSGTTSLTASLIGSSLRFADELLSTKRSELLHVNGAVNSGTFTYTFGFLSPLQVGPFAYDISRADLELFLNNALRFLGANAVSVRGTSISDGGFVIVYNRDVSNNPPVLTTDNTGVGSIVSTLIAPDVDAPLLPAYGIQAGDLATYIGPNRPTFDNPRANAGSGVARGSFEFAFGDLRTAWYEQDGSGASPSDFPVTAGTQNTTVWVPAGANARRVLFEGMRKGDEVWVNAYHRHPVGYEFQYIAKTQVGGVDAFGATNGRYGNNWTFTNIHDDTLGSSQVISIIIDIDEFGPTDETIMVSFA